LGTLSKVKQNIVTTGMKKRLLYGSRQIHPEEQQHPPSLRSLVGPLEDQFSEEEKHQAASQFEQVEHHPVSAGQQQRDPEEHGMTIPHR
jgi:hypothetical protein